MLDDLRDGDLLQFSDWPTSQVPAVAAGVYTIWEGPVLLYAGMGGRGLSPAARETAILQGKRRGLWTRLNAHASGRRSGDQFCIYICDRLVLPSLISDEIAQIADGTLSLDALTRCYIRDRLSFRFVQSADGTTATSLEERARSGQLGLLPTLNPLHNSQDPDNRQAAPAPG